MKIPQSLRESVWTAARRPVRDAADALRRPRGGNVALIVALAIPGAATLAFGAMDVTNIMSDRERMRSIAEAAALAGARSLSVAMSESSAQAQAKSMAQSIAADWTDGPSLTVESAIAQLSGGAKGVTVTLHAVRPSLFGDLLPPGGWHYHADATASSVGAKPLCVLAFDAAEKVNFSVGDSAEIRAPSCLVHSNGDLAVTGGSIEAGQTQAVGTATGEITPAPIVDAPPIDDPFTDLPMPAATTPCTLSTAAKGSLNVSTGVYDLPAGEHCGLIRATGDAIVRLAPGEHHFRLGGIVATDTAQLTGDDIVMRFDLTSFFWFAKEARINLQGRQQGPFAGFVILADRKNIKPMMIDSTHVERLDGVIYVPSAELRIFGTSDVARQSDWTVIVADRLSLSGNPHLYLNTDYGASDIAAPPGVGPRRDAVRLIE